MPPEAVEKDRARIFNHEPHEQIRTFGLLLVFSPLVMAKFKGFQGTYFTFKRIFDIFLYSSVRNGSCGSC